MKRSEISPLVKGVVRGIVLNIFDGGIVSIEQAHEALEDRMGALRSMLYESLDQPIEDVSFHYSVEEYIDDHESDSYEFLMDVFKRLAP